MGKSLRLAARNRYPSGHHDHHDGISGSTRLVQLVAFEAACSGVLRGPAAALRCYRLEVGLLVENHGPLAALSRCRRSALALACLSATYTRRVY